MKKLIVTMLCVIMLFSMSACQSSNFYERCYKFKASEYVTLGQYKDIHIVKDVSVTEEELEKKIREFRVSKATYHSPERTVVENGDVIKIDYTAYKDGVKYNSASGTNLEFQVGEGTVIDDLDRGVIGLEKNVATRVTATFPEDYGNINLAGVTVEFEVIVKNIRVMTLPELTDEYISKNTDYDTYEDYIQGTKESLQKSKETEFKNNLKNNILSEIAKNSEVTEYPTKEYNSIYDNLIEYFTDMAQSQYRMTLTQYLEEIQGINMEIFEKDMADYAKTMLKERLIIMAIVEAEGLDLTKQEYEERAEKYAEEMGFSSVAQLQRYVEPSEIYINMAYDEVMEMLLESTSYEFKTE